MNLTSLELCAGGGGQAIGLSKAGFKHLALVENDKHACETLRVNRPKWNVVEEDLNKFDATPYLGVDLLSAGLPCPPFSVAGKGLGYEDERDLFPQFFRILNECKPKSLLIENVRGMLQPRFEKYLKDIRIQFKTAGYQLIEPRILNAADFGVPQNRQRLILVAFRNRGSISFKWPIPRRQKCTVGECLYDMMASRGWKKVKQWREKANDVAPTLVGGSKKHGGPDLGPTRAKKAWSDIGVNAHVLAVDPPERNFCEMPKLTIPMTGLIQGFPTSWIFTGPKTHAYRQVGNAFPPPVAFAIGRRIKVELTKQLDTETNENHYAEAGC